MKKCNIKAISRNNCRINYLIQVEHLLFLLRLLKNFLNKNILIKYIDDKAKN